MVVREALCALLTAEPDIDVVGQAGDGRATAEQARTLEPDIVIMDLHMPTLDGVAATRLIHTEHPQARIIGLSMEEDPQQA